MDELSCVETRNKELQDIHALEWGKYCGGSLEMAISDLLFVGDTIMDKNSNREKKIIFIQSDKYSQIIVGYGHEEGYCIEEIYTTDVTEIKGHDAKTENMVAAIFE